MQVVENIAEITAQNHSNSSGKDSVKFRGKRSGRVGSGRPVLGKTVPSVLSTTRGLEYYPKTSSTVFPNTDLLVGEYHIYNNLIFIIWYNVV